MLLSLNRKATEKNVQDIFCSSIKNFLQHALKYSAQSDFFRKGLVKIERVEKEVVNTIKGVEKLPMERDQRSLRASLRGGEGEGCDWKIQIHVDGHVNVELIDKRLSVSSRGFW